MARVNSNWSKRTLVALVVAIALELPLTHGSWQATGGEASDDDEKPVEGLHKWPVQQQQPEQTDLSNELSEEPGEESWQQARAGEQANEEQTEQASGGGAPTCEAELDIRSNFSLAARAGFFAVYALFFIFGLLGNGVTLLAMCRKGRRVSIMDIFIANLALSDILLCLFAPITPIYMLYHGQWAFGFLLCRLVVFAQGSSVYISTLTLMCIGIVRRRLVCNPLKEPISTSAAVLINLGTWVLSFLIMLPYQSRMKLLPENCPIKYCEESWEEEKDRFRYSVFTIIFQFLIPFIAVSFSYGSISLEMIQRSNKRLAGQLNAEPSLVIHTNNKSLRSGSVGMATALTLASHLESPPSLVAVQRQADRATHPGKARRALLRLPRRERSCATNRKKLREATCCGPGSCEPQLAHGKSEGQVCSQASLDRQLEEEELSNMDAIETVSEANLSPEVAVCQVDQLSSAQCSPLRHSASTREFELTGTASVSATGANISGKSNNNNNNNVRLGGADILALRERRQAEKNKRLRQMNRKLFCMVVMFVITWLPLNTFNLAQDYFDLSKYAIMKHISLVVHLVAVASVCYNPILYAWMSDNYRQELRELCPRLLARACRWLTG